LHCIGQNPEKYKLLKRQLKYRHITGKKSRLKIFKNKTIRQMLLEAKRTLLKC